jgi:predicted PurR-regulated permease PerM
LSVVFIFIAIVGLLVYLVVPPVVSQIGEFAQSMPYLIEKISYLKNHFPSLQNYLDSLSTSLSGYTGGVVSFTVGIFGGIITIISALVLFIYLLIDEQAMKKALVSIFPITHREKLTEVVKKVANQVGNWFRGHLTLATIVAFVYLIGLTIIGVPYAAMLAVLAGVLDFIPVIGPIIAGTVAAFIALSESPIKALIVIILYIAVQQLENTVLVPKIMQKALGLSPVIILAALLIGAKLMGIIGAVLAVPISASISVIIQEWPTIKRAWEKSEV